MPESETLNSIIRSQRERGCIKRHYLPADRWQRARLPEKNEMKSEGKRERDGMEVISGLKERTTLVRAVKT